MAIRRAAIDMSHVQCTALQAQLEECLHYRRIAIWVGILLWDAQLA